MFMDFFLVLIDYAILRTFNRYLFPNVFEAIRTSPKSLFIYLFVKKKQQKKNN